MSSALEVESELCEEEFQIRFGGKGLSAEEWECLRRYYKRPYNEKLVSDLGITWMEYVLRTLRRLMGYPICPY